MLVLQVETSITTPSGNTLRFPMGVDDADLDAFGERLCREGGAMVTKLRLERRADGYAYIVDEERIFLGLAAVSTIRNHDWPVRREVDDETGPQSYSEVVAGEAA